MKTNDIPVIGKINRTISSIISNFVILGILALGLGVAALFYPKVSDILIAVFLIGSGLGFFNIAFRIHHGRKKYTEWIDV